jgi:hypothetical protein
MMADVEPTADPGYVTPDRDWRYGPQRTVNVRHCAVEWNGRRCCAAAFRNARRRGIGHQADRAVLSSAPSSLARSDGGGFWRVVPIYRAEIIWPVAPFWADTEALVTRDHVATPCVTDQTG